MVAALGVAGCAAPRIAAPSAAPAAAPPSVAARTGILLGATAATLLARFGEPALDFREGPARKLQFLGASCTLDAYLYPPGDGAEPVVAHADARLPEGQEVDRDACVATLGAPEAAR